MERVSMVTFVSEVAEAITAVVTATLRLVAEVAQAVLNVVKK